MEIATFEFVVEQSAFEAFESIRRALEGDMSALAQRVRTGAALRDDERAFIADFLEGKNKRAAHRPKKAATALRRLDIAKFVHLYEQIHGCKRDAAVIAAEAHFDVTPRHVFKCLKELMSDPRGARQPIYAKGMADFLRSGAVPGDGTPIKAGLDLSAPIYPPTE